jgi:hypothetical protein
MLVALICTLLASNTGRPDFTGKVDLFDTAAECRERGRRFERIYNEESRKHGTGSTAACICEVER